VTKQLARSVLGSSRQTQLKVKSLQHFGHHEVLTDVSH